MKHRWGQLVVLQLIFAAVSFGQPTITVTPALPTPGQPVEVTVTQNAFFCAELESVDVSDHTIRIGLHYACNCLPSNPLPTEIPVSLDPLPVGRYTLSIEIETADQGSCTPGTETFDRPIHVSSRIGIVSTELVPEMPASGDEVSLVVETLCDRPFAFVVARIGGNLIEIDPLPPPPVVIDCEPDIDPLSRSTVPLGSLDAGTKVVAFRSGVPGGSDLDLVQLLEIAPGAEQAALTLADRFAVDATWRTLGDRTGEARGEPFTGSDRSGVLWFFRPSNTELMVKVLDGCQINGHYWMFATGLTNLEVDLTVSDTTTGARRRVHNPLGRPFEPVLDTRAFDCE